MVHIGDFEAAVREVDPAREPDTFGLGGETFTIAQDINIIALGRFARAAREGADSNDMEGLASLIDTVSSLVVPEDETRFLDKCSRLRVDGDFLMKIIQSVLEAQSGYPTEQPSDSSGGSPTTMQSSKVLSSSVESSTRQQPAWADTPFGRRELAAQPELYKEFVDVEHLDLAQFATS